MTPRVTCSAHEAAALLGVHYKTVIRQLNAGKFPFSARMVGGRWRISKAEIEEAFCLSE